MDRRNYFMDATFKVCPYGEFKQLLIIYIEYMEQVTINCSLYIIFYFDFHWKIYLFFSVQTIPFIFVLMTRKSEACYRHILTYIEKNVFSLKCASFMTDFETAMRNAVRSLYPRSKHFGCWFHFAQAVKRHASKIENFVVTIRSNAQARKIYHKFMCIPLLPVHAIEDAFYELEIEALAFDSTFFQRFLRYFENQWIRKVRNN